MQGPAVIPGRGARSHTPCGEVKQQIKRLIRYHMNFPSIKRKCKNPIKQAVPCPRPACCCDSHLLQSRSTSEAPQAGPWPPGSPSCRWPWAHDPSFSAARRLPTLRALLTGPSPRGTQAAAAPRPGDSTISPCSPFTSCSRHTSPGGTPGLGTPGGHVGSMQLPHFT